MTHVSPTASPAVILPKLPPIDCRASVSRRVPSGSVTMRAISEAAISPPGPVVIAGDATNPTVREYRGRDPSMKRSGDLGPVPDRFRFAGRYVEERKSPGHRLCDPKPRPIPPHPVRAHQLRRDPPLDDRGRERILRRARKPALYRPAAAARTNARHLRGPRRPLTVHKRDRQRFRPLLRARASTPVSDPRTGPDTGAAPSASAYPRRRLLMIGSLVPCWLIFTYNRSCAVALRIALVSLRE